MPVETGDKKDVDRPPEEGEAEADVRRKKRRGMRVPSDDVPRPSPPSAPMAVVPQPVHVESEVEFDVDVEQAYFSPRLAREHERVSSAVRPGERVYDLCCGVGPFAVTVARDGRAQWVTAVDSNPRAIDLLRATLARYPFGGRVVPVLARLEEFLPSSGPADRVIFNLIGAGATVQLGNHTVFNGSLLAPQGEFTSGDGDTPNPVLINGALLFGGSIAIGNNTNLNFYPFVGAGGVITIF